MIASVGLLCVEPICAQDGGTYTTPLPPKAPGGQAFIEPAGRLTLSEAVASALLRNPQLTAFGWEVRAAEVRALRAGLLPNPELALEVEEIGGSGNARGFDRAETTLALSQLIELGGKRMRRRGLARTDRDLAGWDYEAMRVEVVATVAAAYTDVLAGQRRTALARETGALAQRVYNTVAARVEAGKVSPIEEVKAHVEAAKARLDLRRIEQALIGARHRLAATWASSTPGFVEVLGEFETVTSPPPLDGLVARLSGNPDLARWAAEMSRRQTAVSLARAEAVPDLTVSAGVRHLAEDDDVAAVVGLSLPLFVFDNKRSGVEEAEIGVTQGMQLRQAAEVKVRLALVEAYQRLQMAYVEGQMIRDQVLPSAQVAFEAISEAYRLGKVGALDLLDTQRTLIQTRHQYIDALAANHRAVVAIERLIGGALHPTEEE